MGDTYEIRVRGHLDRRWENYFRGMKIELLENGETRLCGEVTDQAALHSLISRIRDLGMTLLLVKYLGTLDKNDQATFARGNEK